MKLQTKLGSDFGVDGLQAPEATIAPPPARRWHEIGASPPSRAMWMTGQILRGVAAVLTLVAAIVMGTAQQTKRIVVIDDSGSPVTLSGTAKSHYSSALVYFIVINVLTLLYSAATLAFSASRMAAMGGLPLSLSISDLLATIFLVSGNGAAAAVSVVAENGNRHFGWDRICESVARYCARVSASIALSMSATASYFALILITLIYLHKRL